MDIVFLAFANSREVPLPTLREEDEKVYSILSRRPSNASDRRRPPPRGPSRCCATVPKAKLVSPARSASVSIDP